MCEVCVSMDAGWKVVVVGASSRVLSGVPGELTWCVGQWDCGCDNSRRCRGGLGRAQWLGLRVQDGRLVVVGLVWVRAGSDS